MAADPRITNNPLWNQNIVGQRTIQFQQTITLNKPAVIAALESCAPIPPLLVVIALSRNARLYESLDESTCNEYRRRAKVIRTRFMRSAYGSYFFQLSGFSTEFRGRRKI